MVRTIQE